MGGQTVTAQRALAMGLVHDVFADASFAEDVRSFARQLVDIPAEAMGLAKMIIDMSVDTDRTAQRQIDWLANTTLTASDTYRDNVARFQKRTT
jgi:enoyl-CoA hydratase/carnithine racemase